MILKRGFYFPACIALKILLMRFIWLLTRSWWTDRWWTERSNRERRNREEKTEKLIQTEITSDAHLNKNDTISRRRTTFCFDHVSVCRGGIAKSHYFLFRSRFRLSLCRRTDAMKKGARAITSPLPSVLGEILYSGANRKLNSARPVKN